MNQIKRTILAGLAVTLVANTGALAGPYGDDLAKCLVKSTTAAEKGTLVQWMFATMALHPDVKWMAAITADQRAKLNEKTAKQFETLLTKTCLAETKAALKYEGASTFESSFNVLGTVAARELMSHPSVVAGNEEFAKYLDTDAMKSLLEPPKAADGKGE
jgi:hypothetical protein